MTKYFIADCILFLFLFFQFQTEKPTISKLKLWTQKKEEAYNHGSLRASCFLNMEEKHSKLKKQIE